MKEGIFNVFIGLLLLTGTSKNLLKRLNQRERERDEGLSVKFP